MKHKRVVLLFACKDIGLEQRWQTTGTDTKFGTSDYNSCKYLELPDDSIVHNFL
jgi:hypothetical protein